MNKSPTAIRIYLKEEGVWIHVAHNGVQWRALVNT
jgi:hypothetical protein